jgi:hypothetical protein
MTGNRQKWQDVTLIAQAESLKVARERFFKKFGFKIDSKEVDAEIMEAFEVAENRWLDGEDQDDTVAIPIELIFALTLREGFARGKGRRRKSNVKKRKLILAIGTAEKLRAENVAAGMGKGEARERAIQETAEREGVDASILRDQMGRSRK